MPRSTAAQTARENARREIEHLYNGGEFRGNVNLFSDNHWRAVKELHGELYVRIPSGETVTPSAQRAYPCWVKFDERYLSMGLMLHDVVESLINRSNSPAHNNIVYGLRVRVQPHTWQTPSERAAAQEAAQARDLARMSFAVPNAPLRSPSDWLSGLSPAKVRSFQNMERDGTDTPIHELSSWVHEHCAEMEAPLLCSYAGSTPDGEPLFTTILEFRGHTIRCRGRSSTPQLRRLLRSWPNLRIFTRIAGSDPWERLRSGRPSATAAQAPMAIDWTAAPGQPIFHDPPPLTPTQARRAALRAEYQEKYDAMPRGRRNACRSLFHELSREDLTRIGVRHSDESELDARDFVRLSGELATRALADEENDDVLQDNANDYSTG